jgi:hypothetical protein
VDIPEGALFSCWENADCGEGALCAPTKPGALGICCIPDVEVCDGKDNDCDGNVDDGTTTSCYEGPSGTVDVGLCRAGQRYCVNGTPAGDCLLQVVPQAETCNGGDDDCDGQVDEGLPLDSDPNNCGACGNRCLSTQQCKNGACIWSSESSCENNVDDDQDGAKDCEDSDCNNRACGAGCTCEGGIKHESNCSDRSPTGGDNDGDGSIDCDDPDCASQQCKAAPATFTCDAVALTCTCNGSEFPPAESVCYGGSDEDCDGLIDCADPDCNSLSCASVPGCECRNGARHETNCADAVDNDGDAMSDCRDDLDCPKDTPCGTNKVCRQNRSCG